MSRPPRRGPGTKRAQARAQVEARKAAERAAAERRRRRQRLGWAGAAILIAVVAVVLVQVLRTSGAATTVPANTAAGTSNSAFEIGNPTAPVVVDVYEDFQCPVCKEFESQDGATLSSLVDEGKARVRYHPIAILDRASTDKYSTRAANAAAVVADAAGTAAFLKFHSALYAAQPAEGGAGLTDDQLVSMAAAAGAKGTAVDSGIRDLRFGDWTATVTAESSKAGVTSTPTVLVNGTVLQDRSAQSLEAAIAAAAGSQASTPSG